MRDFQKQISAMAESLLRAFEQSYPGMEAAADRLVSLGWCLPMQVSPRALISLANPANSCQEIEAALVKVYSDDNCKELRSVEKDLSASPELFHWADLLQEMFTAFHSGLHQITIPALLTVIESVITSETGKFATNC